MDFSMLLFGVLCTGIGILTVISPDRVNSVVLELRGLMWGSKERASHLSWPATRRKGVFLTIGGVVVTVVVICFGLGVMG